RRDFNELRTFIGGFPKKTTGLGAGWKRRRGLCPIRRRQSTLKTNVRNADNEFWRGARISLKTLELWDTKPCVSAGAGAVEVRRLSLFAVAKSPFPCKDHPLGRRREGPRAIR